MNIASLLLIGLALAADGGSSSEGQTMKSPNLARLGETMPGAARVLAWAKGGKEVEAPSLADGDRKAAAKLPADWSAFGVAWAVRHVVDRAEVFFVGAAAPPASLELQAFDGEGWVAVRDGLKAEARPGGKAIRYSFEPVATAAMRLAAKGARPAVCELEIHPYTPARPGGRITWPKRMAGRELEEQILARRQEPSFEGLSLHGLSMPVWSTMGIKDWPHEQAVSWDGRILVPLFKIAAGVGDPPRGFADVRDTVRRSLIDGWLPGVEVEGQFGDVALKQTSFVTFIDAARKKPGLFLRFEVRNVSKRPLKTALQVRLDWDDGKTQLTCRDGALVRGKATYLVCGGPCRAGAAKNAIAWDVALPAGATRTFTAAAPVNYDGRTPISSHLRGAGYDEALASFRGYWRELLAPAMKLEVPEKRINNLYRSVLTQIYINADGDVMPYGSMPSAYDGALYGVEEGYAMMALAMSGLGHDAQRYMDRTYLHKQFLRKVEKYGGYGDRHQQYRNGLQPMYAVAAYRITRDRKWITGHLPLLTECAEWTIATRRKTMEEEGGKRPLHWGLLPKWSYGGDIADRQCYPLYANIACWRGLHDTAWLMERLGHRKAAGRLAKEADEYRKVIERVVDKIYRADAKPPFLPPHVYATGPDGREYYQLFAGCILDLLPFEFAHKRAEYLPRFLEQDNRTFCMLPRFRRDVNPGGLDAIYGLGYMLTKLHQGKIKEFLLGFYAFQAFNMEHTCFTSRETNAIYASDAHLRTRFPVPEKSDPLPCSSAVALLLLRHMLVTEETVGAGKYTGNLLLLFGAPRKWFGSGRKIAVRNAPTHFGKVSFSVASRADEGLVEAEVAVAKRSPPKCLKLRLRHPSGRKFKRVLVNGKAHADVDARAELIVIRQPGGKYLIQARY